MKMKTEQWAVLAKWYYKNYKTLPKNVMEIIEALLDDHQNQND
jgi:hypothetical protein